MSGRIAQAAAVGSVIRDVALAPGYRSGLWTAAPGDLIPTRTPPGVRAAPSPLRSLNGGGSVAVEPQLPSGSGVQPVNGGEERGGWEAHRGAGLYIVSVVPCNFARRATRMYASIAAAALFQSATAASVDDAETALATPS